jgi:enoyl-CoA hydratase/carnithine racemase
MIVTGELLIEAQGQIEIVTLSRPERLNAMNHGLIMALQDYFRGLHDRLAVRVVILRGSGRAFCAGLDLTPGSWPVDPGAGGVQAGWKTQRAIATVMQLMRSCPQPVIALATGQRAAAGSRCCCRVTFGSPRPT